MKNRIILTNINEYYVTDQGNENLVFKAHEYGIKEILVGPSSIPGMINRVKKYNLSLSVSIAYPSGAYEVDAKTEEIEELNSLYPEIESYYVVINEGLFLSGKAEILKNEVELLIAAAEGRKVFAILEIGSLDEEKAKVFLEICRTAGVNGIMISTGFNPYKQSFPTEEKIKLFKKSANDMELIGTGIDQRTAIELGCDKVLVSKNIDQMISALEFFE